MHKKSKQTAHANQTKPSQIFSSFKGGTDLFVLMKLTQRIICICTTSFKLQDICNSLILTILKTTMQFTKAPSTLTKLRHCDIAEITKLRYD